MFRATKIVVHHSSSEDGKGNNTANIRHYHVVHNGWTDIGYHGLSEFISPDYEVLMGRPWDQMGAHCLGQNDTALGICFVGNWNDVPPPDGQLRVGAKLIKMWMRMYGIGIENVRAHREFSNTDCPGHMFSIDRLKEYLR